MLVRSDWQTDVLQPTLSALATMRWKVSSLCESLAKNKNSTACCFNQAQKSKLPSLCLLCLRHPFPLNVLVHPALFCACCSPVAFTGVWSISAPILRRRWDALCSSAVSVAEATAGSTLDGGNIALAVFILVLLLSVLLGGAYVYVTRWALQALGLPAWSLKSCLWLTALTSSQCCALAFSTKQPERCWPDFSS